MGLSIWRVRGGRRWGGHGIFGAEFSRASIGRKRWSKEPWYDDRMEHRNGVESLSHRDLIARFALLLLHEWKATSEARDGEAGASMGCGAKRSSRVRTGRPTSLPSSVMGLDTVLADSANVGHGELSGGAIQVCGSELTVRYEAASGAARDAFRDAQVLRGRSRCGPTTW